MGQTADDVFYCQTVIFLFVWEWKRELAVTLSALSLSVTLIN